MYIDYGFKRALIIIAVITLLGLLVVKTSVFDGITIIKPQWAGMTIGSIKEKFGGDAKQTPARSGQSQESTSPAQGSSASELMEDLT